MADVAEYPKHLHRKGGEFLEVKNKEEEDRAKGKGWSDDFAKVQAETEKETLGKMPPNQRETEERERRQRDAQPDDTEIVRMGAARADHEAKANAEVSKQQRENAEREAAKRGDDDLKPEDFIREGDKPNALNRRPEEKRPEDAIRPGDKPNALNRPKK